MHTERKLEVLVLFSDPPGTPRLRLGLEDKTISAIAEKYASAVRLTKIHASQIDDIHTLLLNKSYDVIHFSGHGSEEGIYLEREDYSPEGELVSARRLQSVLEISDQPPRLVILMACYSQSSLEIIAKIAPFVISAVGPVRDDVCIEFDRGFYDRLFSGSAINKAFNDALKLLDSKLLPSDNFQFDRRNLVIKGKSKFIESTPDSRNNSILVNVDSIQETIEKINFEREEIYHLISRKMMIHYWIFSVPRERCIIPIGRFLFGEFSWEDADDVVVCRRLIKFREDTHPDMWRIWVKLLIAYNDLASHEYRILSYPANPSNKAILANAVKLFSHNIERSVRRVYADILELKIKDCIPNVQFIFEHIEAAKDHLDLERFPQLVQALEETLTNFHELVDRLQPKEENP